MAYIVSIESQYFHDSLQNERRGRKTLKASMMIWGYENMSDTCALNKGRSNRISNLEELGSRDCGVELGER